jgi:hypothetical protein
MGVDGSEFTNPSGGGRVQFYLGTGNTDTNGNYGQKINNSTPKQSALFATDAGTSQPVINNYDMTVFACQGDNYAQKASDMTTLRNYAASGGRVFATHYNYTWLAKNDQNTAQAGIADNWSEVAKWHEDDADRTDGSMVGHIDLVSNPKGAAFKGWLEAVNASTPNSGDVSVNVVRHDTDLISSVPGKTQQWLYRDGANFRKCTISGATCTSNASCTPKVCSVNTAFDCSVNACTKVCKNNPTTVCTLDSQCTGTGNACVSQTCGTNTCGNQPNYAGTQVPLHFTYNTPVNLKEDLSSNPPALQCGRVLFSDFHVEDAREHDKIFPAQCGAVCTADTQCDPGGKCVSGFCLNPMTAQEKLLEYMIFDLGSCVPPPETCEPATTCPAGQDCGYAPDGCGGLVACGECKAGEACGVGNPPVANKCGKGTSTCVPTTCAAQNLECGPAADGCGEKIDSCGTCSAGELCIQGRCAHVN